MCCFSAFLRIKLKHAEELEAVLLREKEQLERTRQELFAQVRYIPCPSMSLCCGAFSHGIWISLLCFLHSLVCDPGCWFGEM